MIFFSTAELVFLAAVIFTMIVPVPSPDKITAAHMQSITNVLSVAWQTLALAPVLGFVAFINSSEWLHIYRSDGKRFHTGSTDRVSNMNGGWIPRARHAISSSPSTPFRLCFLVALLVPALTSIGASTFEVGWWLGWESTRIVVANVTFAEILKLLCRSDRKTGHGGSPP